MAHPNIDERRAFVEDLLNNGARFDNKLRSEIAQKFNCHISAINADLKHFKYQHTKSSSENQHELAELQNERQRIEAEGYFDVENLEDARQRVTASIVQRQGQSEFRHKLLTAYNSQCPISGCDAEPALEAAHILPYQGSQTNHPTNGLPLRADIHTLFDLYLLSIQPDTYQIVIAPKLSKTCYQKFADKKLTLPVDELALPSREALRKHYENFLQKHELVQSCPQPNNSGAAD